MAAFANSLGRHQRENSLLQFHVLGVLLSAKKKEWAEPIAGGKAASACTEHIRENK
jgi:hypothetical protein